MPPLSGDVPETAARTIFLLFPFWEHAILALVQIIARRTLKQFWERHRQAEIPLRNWYTTVAAADWKGPSDINKRFGATADFVADNRVVFDIAGNKYRLIVHVAYRYRRVLIKFIGYAQGIRQDRSEHGVAMARAATAQKSLPTLRPLKSEADYDAALAEISAYFEREPEPGTPEADRFDLLALVVADYEDKHWPIDPPDAVEAIRYRMDLAGFRQADLARLIGSRSRASEIMNRKRALTLEMAWRLNREWHIPAEALLKPYSLVKGERARSRRGAADRTKAPDGL